MKNTFLLVLGSLLVFTACNTKTDSEEGVSSSSSSNSILSLAFVNSDSLALNYAYFDEISEELEAKRAKYETEFANRANGLQRQIEDYQKTATNMTIAQARAVEEDLTRKQQNLQQYQQSLSQELAKEEDILNKKLYETVASYLKKYGEDNQLDFIFKYSAGGEIWYGNSAMDITFDVVEGLNQEYTSRSADGETSSNDSTTSK